MTVEEIEIVVTAKVEEALKEFEKMLFLPGEIFCRCRKNEEHSTGGEA